MRKIWKPFTVNEIARVRILSRRGWDNHRIAAKLRRNPSRVTSLIRRLGLSEAMSNDHRQFLEENYGLVISSVRRHLSRCQLPMNDEWVSTAALFVCQKMRQYNPSKGCSLTTWIHNMAEFAVRVTMSRLNAKRKRPMEATFSLLPSDEKGEGTSGIRKRAELTPDELLSQRESLTLLEKVLTPRQFSVLWQRYAEGRSLSQVGDLLGVCRERVRQIEVAALKKARACLHDEDE